MKHSLGSILVNAKLLQQCHKWPGSLRAAPGGAPKAPWSSGQGTPTVPEALCVDTRNEGMISMDQPEFGSYAMYGYMMLYGQILYMFHMDIFYN